MGRLAGKVAIITGAAKGLGEADARLMASEGARLVLTDVDVANGERVAAEIGAAARFVRQDVREEDGWIALIADVMAKEGRLDILVNNAGVVEAGHIENTTAEAWHFVMAVSADGTFFGCKHAIPAMKQSGGGSIINMASVCSIGGFSAVTAYCAAKGAIESLTRAIAVHCTQNGLNIRCNTIHPGTMDTPIHAVAPGKTQPALVLSFGMHQLGVALECIHHSMCVLPGLFHRVRLGLEPAVHKDLPALPVGLPDGSGAPVFHFQNQDAAPRVHHHKVWMEVFGAYGYVIPEQVVVVEFLFESLGQTPLAGGHAGNARTDCRNKSRHPGIPTF